MAVFETTVNDAGELVVLVPLTVRQLAALNIHLQDQDVGDEEVALDTAEDVLFAAEEHLVAIIEDVEG